MRATPSVIAGALGVYDGGATSTTSGITTAFLSSTVVELDFSLTTSSLTLGRAAILYQGGTETMTLSAEL
jgi:hypothetical protein